MTKKFGILLSLGLCFIALAGKLSMIHSEPLSPNIFYGKSLAEITQIFNEDVRSILSSEDSAKIKAEKFAELGETALEVPSSSEFAIYAFDKALLQDSLNPKANFYSALMNPVLSIRGVAVRMAKILTPDEVSRETFKISDGINNPDAKRVVSNILNDPKGEKIFKTPSDVQLFITSTLLPILSESERRLEIVARSKSFQLTFDTRAWSDASESKPRKKMQVMIDQVEVRSAQVILKGIEALAKIAVSYDLEGALAIRDQFLGKPNVTPKMVMDSIRKYPKILTLKPGGAEYLKSIVPMAAESVEGLKIIANLVKSIEDRNDVAIVGSFRNNDKVQGSPDEDYNQFMMSLQFVTGLLAGPQEIGIFGSRHEHIYDNPTTQPWNYRCVDIKTEVKKILFNGPILFLNPLPDLKPVFLVDMDEKGREMVGAPDPTFGGVFPNGDMFSTWHSFGENPKWWIHIDFLVNYKKEESKEGEKK